MAISKFNVGFADHSNQERCLFSISADKHKLYYNSPSLGSGEERMITVRTSTLSARFIAGCGPKCPCPSVYLMLHTQALRSTVIASFALAGQLYFPVRRPDLENLARRSVANGRNQGGPGIGHGLPLGIRAGYDGTRVITAQLEKLEFPFSYKIVNETL